MLGMMLPFIVDITMAGSGLGRDSAIAEAVRWMSTGSHVDRMLQGLVSHVRGRVLVCVVFVMPVPPPWLFSGPWSTP